MACVFCRIITGEEPARIVYESDRAVGFLDINPLAPGHTLVVPRTHVRRLKGLSAESAAGVMRAVHALVEPVEAAVAADAVTVAVNDGPAAGQEVPHVHAHLVPRNRADGHGPIHALFTDRPRMSPAEMDEIQADIRAHAPE